MLKLFTILLAYLVMQVRFYIGEPDARRNFAAEANGKFANVPIDERAWTYYRKAAKVREQVGAAGQSRAFSALWPDIRPGDAQWPEAVAFLSRNKEALALARKAAAIPVLGRPVTNAVDPVFHQAGDDPPWPTRANPPVLTWELRHLGFFRYLARCFLVDAVRAAEAGDAEMVVADVNAIMGLSRHSRELGEPISDLVALAIAATGFKAIGEVLERWPDLLDDGQVQRLAAAAISAFGPGRVPFRLEGQTRQFEDELQRMFTDDGNGDGRLTAEGQRHCNDVAGNPHDLTMDQRLLCPIGSCFMAGRKELHDEWDRITAILQREAGLPAWERSWAFEDELARCEGDPKRSARYATVYPLAHAVALFPATAETTTQRRDAALVTCALARYRLRHGKYPAALCELVPDYLSEVPPDRIDGKPLRYLAPGGKPVLYSIGADEDDDGGRQPANPDDLSTLMRRARPAERGAVDGDWVLWERTGN